MYAIVRSGGRQHKVAVGDLIEVDKVDDPMAGASLQSGLALLYAYD